MRNVQCTVNKLNVVVIRSEATRGNYIIFTNSRCCGCCPIINELSTKVTFVLTFGKTFVTNGKRSELFAVVFLALVTGGNCQFFLRNVKCPVIEYNVVVIRSKATRGNYITFTNSRCCGCCSCERQRTAKVPFVFTFGKTFVRDGKGCIIKLFSVVFLALVIGGNCQFFLCNVQCTVNKLNVVVIRSKATRGNYITFTNSRCCGCCPAENERTAKVAFVFTFGKTFVRDDKGCIIKLIAVVFLALVTGSNCQFFLRNVQCPVIEYNVVVIRSKATRGNYITFTNSGCCGCCPIINELSTKVAFVLTFGKTFVTNGKGCIIKLITVVFLALVIGGNCQFFLRNVQCTVIEYNVVVIRSKATRGNYIIFTNSRCCGCCPAENERTAKVAFVFTFCKAFVTNGKGCIIKLITVVFLALVIGGNCQFFLRNVQCTVIEYNVVVIRSKATRGNYIIFTNSRCCGCCPAENERTAKVAFVFTFCKAFVTNGKGCIIKLITVVFLALVIGGNCQFFLRNVQCTVIEYNVVVIRSKATRGNYIIFTNSRCCGCCPAENERTAKVAFVFTFCKAFVTNGKGCIIKLIAVVFLALVIGSNCQFFLRNVQCPVIEYNVVVIRSKATRGNYIIFTNSRCCGCCPIINELSTKVAFVLTFGKAFVTNGKGCIIKLISVVFLALVIGGNCQFFLRNVQCTVIEYNVVVIRSKATRGNYITFTNSGCCGCCPIINELSTKVTFVLTFGKTFVTNGKRSELFTVVFLALVIGSNCQFFLRNVQCTVIEYNVVVIRSKATRGNYIIFTNSRCCGCCPIINELSTKVAFVLTFGKTFVTNGKGCIIKLISVVFLALVTGGNCQFFLRNVQCTVIEYNVVVIRSKATRGNYIIFTNSRCCGCCPIINELSTKVAFVLTFGKTFVTNGKGCIIKLISVVFLALVTGGNCQFFLRNVQCTVIEYNVVVIRSKATRGNYITFTNSGCCGCCPIINELSTKVTFVLTFCKTFVRDGKGCIIKLIAVVFLALVIGGNCQFFLCNVQCTVNKLNVVVIRSKATRGNYITFTNSRCCGCCPAENERTAKVTFVLTFGKTFVTNGKRSELFTVVFLALVIGSNCQFFLRNVQCTVNKLNVVVIRSEATRGNYIIFTNSRCCGCCPIINELSTKVTFVLTFGKTFVTNGKRSELFAVVFLALVTGGNCQFFLRNVKCPVIEYNVVVIRSKATRGNYITFTNSRCCGCCSCERQRTAKVPFVFTFGKTFVRDGKGCIIKLFSVVFLALVIGGNCQFFLCNVQCTVNKLNVVVIRSKATRGNYITFTNSRCCGCCSCERQRTAKVAFVFTFGKTFVRDDKGCIIKLIAVVFLALVTGSNCQFFLRNVQCTVIEYNVVVIRSKATRGNYITFTNSGCCGCCPIINELSTKVAFVLTFGKTFVTNGKGCIIKLITVVFLALVIGGNCQFFLGNVQCTVIEYNVVVIRSKATRGNYIIFTNSGCCGCCPAENERTAKVAFVFTFCKAFVTNGKGCIIKLITVVFLALVIGGNCQFFLRNVQCTVIEYNVVVIRSKATRGNYIIFTNSRCCGCCPAENERTAKVAFVFTFCKAFVTNGKGCIIKLITVVFLALVIGGNCQFFLRNVQCTVIEYNVVVIRSKATRGNYIIFTNSRCCGCCPAENERTAKVAFVFTFCKAFVTNGKGCIIKLIAVVFLALVIGSNCQFFLRNVQCTVIEYNVVVIRSKATRGNYIIFTNSRCCGCCPIINELSTKVAFVLTFGKAFVTNGKGCIIKLISVVFLALVIGGNCQFFLRNVQCTVIEYNVVVIRSKATRGNYITFTNSGCCGCCPIINELSTKVTFVLTFGKTFVTNGKRSELFTVVFLALVIGSNCQFFLRNVQCTVNKLNVVVIRSKATRGNYIIFTNSRCCGCCPIINELSTKVAFVLTFGKTFVTNGKGCIIKLISVVFLALVTGGNCQFFLRNVQCTVIEYNVVVIRSKATRGNYITFTNSGCCGCCPIINELSTKVTFVLTFGKTFVTNGKRSELFAVVFLALVIGSNCQFFLRNVQCTVNKLNVVVIRSKATRGNYIIFTNSRCCGCCPIINELSTKVAFVLTFGKTFVRDGKGCIIKLISVVFLALVTGGNCQFFLRNVQCTVIEYNVVVIRSKATRGNYIIFTNSRCCGCCPAENERTAKVAFVFTFCKAFVTNGKGCIIKLIAVVFLALVIGSNCQFFLRNVQCPVIEYNVVVIRSKATRGNYIIFTNSRCCGCCPIINELSTKVAFVLTFGKAFVTNGKGCIIKLISVVFLALVIGGNCQFFLRNVQCTVIEYNVVVIRSKATRGNYITFTNSGCCGCCPIINELSTKVTFVLTFGKTFVTNGKRSELFTVVFLALVIGSNCQFFLRNVQCTVIEYNVVVIRSKATRGNYIIFTNSGCCGCCPAENERTAKVAFVFTFCKAFVTNGKGCIIKLITVVFLALVIGGNCQFFLRNVQCTVIEYNVVVIRSKATRGNYIIFTNSRCCGCCPAENERTAKVAFVFTFCKAFVTNGKGCIIKLITVVFLALVIGGNCQFFLRNVQCTVIEYNVVVIRSKATRGNYIIFTNSRCCGCCPAENERTAKVAFVFTFCKAFVTNGKGCIIKLIAVVFLALVIGSNCQFFLRNVQCTVIEYNVVVIRSKATRGNYIIFTNSRCCGCCPIINELSTKVAFVLTFGKAFVTNGKGCIIKLISVVFLALVIGGNCQFFLRNVQCTVIEYNVVVIRSKATRGNYITFTNSGCCGCCPIINELSTKVTFVLTFGKTFVTNGKGCIIKLISVVFLALVIGSNCQFFLRNVQCPVIEYNVVVIRSKATRGNYIIFTNSRCCGCCPIINELSTKVAFVLTFGKAFVTNGKGCIIKLISVVFLALVIGGNCQFFLRNVQCTVIEYNVVVIRSKATRGNYITFTNSGCCGCCPIINELSTKVTFVLTFGKTFVTNGKRSELFTVVFLALVIGSNCQFFLRNVQCTVNKLNVVVIRSKATRGNYIIFTNSRCCGCCPIINELSTKVAFVLTFGKTFVTNGKGCIIKLISVVFLALVTGGNCQFFLRNVQCTVIEYNVVVIRSKATRGNYITFTNSGCCGCCPIINELSTKVTFVLTFGKTFVTNGKRSELFAVVFLALVIGSNCQFSSFCVMSSVPSTN